jgi:hypothetical protein
MKQCHRMLLLSCILLVFGASGASSQPTRRSRSYAVLVADSVVRSLAAADSEFGSSTRRAGLQNLVDELVRNLCEIHTGGPARSTVMAIHEWVPSGVGSDSIRISPTGAHCRDGRGDGGLSSAHVIVLSAEVACTCSESEVERIVLKATMQLNVTDLEGLSAMWLWRSSTGWRLQKYDKGSMDWIPNTPASPLVRTPLSRPPT